MCGFAVYTGSDKKTRVEIPAEFQKLKYRGPDNTIIKDFGEKGWMGFHRLLPTMETSPWYLKIFILSAMGKCIIILS
jgi:hypothetical protein